MTMAVTGLSMEEETDVKVRGLDVIVMSHQVREEGLLTDSHPLDPLHSRLVGIMLGSEILVHAECETDGRGDCMVVRGGMVFGSYVCAPGQKVVSEQS